MTTLVDHVELPAANGEPVRVPLSAVLHPQAEATAEQVAEQAAAVLGEHRGARKKKTPPKHVLGDTKVEKALAGIIALLMLALAAAGMFVSFTTVQLNLQPWFPGHHRSAVVPLGVDIGILVFGMADILLAYWGIKARLPRMFELGLVAATAWLNIAGNEPAWVQAAHIVMPSLWAVSVATVRKVVLARLDLINETETESIRPARWILAPWTTFWLWRRMVLWEIKSYTSALDMEFERLAAVAVAKQHWGSKWKKRLPGDVVMKLRMGLIPAAEVPTPPGKKTHHAGDRLRPVPAGTGASAAGDGDGLGSRDGDGDEQRPGDDSHRDGDEGSGTNAGDGDGSGPRDGGDEKLRDGAGDGDGDETDAGDGDESGPREETPGDGDEDEQRRRPAPRPRRGPRSNPRPSTAGHLAGSTTVPDDHHVIVRRVAQDAMAAGESLTRENLAPRFRKEGIRRRNGEWKPYVDAAKRAVA